MRRANTAFLLVIVGLVTLACRPSRSPMAGYVFQSVQISGERGQTADIVQAALEQELSKRGVRIFSNSTGPKLLCTATYTMNGAYPVRLEIIAHSDSYPNPFHVAADVDAFWNSDMNYFSLARKAAEQVADSIEEQYLAQNRE